ncbi:MAG TPA: hypothetical protein VFK57_19590 [Vicinamibacterales bacterium]|nr:hypothetical protein [Vicinamibacterales bacterium]
MPPRDPRRAFTAAVDALAAQLRGDTSILAAILGGSLAHDTVWDKSDVDLVLITIDEAKIAADSISLYADGVNVHAMLITRAAFRKLVQGSLQNSFMHSFLAKGRLLYTHDQTIAQLCDTLHTLGERDRELQLLRAATAALGPLYKAHKWLITRGDLDYAALWLLYTATPLAMIEVIGAGRVAGREVIPEALTLNPAVFSAIYTSLLHQPVTRARIDTALATVDRYLADRTPALFAAVFKYLRDAGEARGCAEIEHHFTRTLGVDGVTIACEYLADQRLIGKVSLPVRLTKRSTAMVQELAFVHLQPAADPLDDEHWEPGEPGTGRR